MADVGAPVSMGSGQAMQTSASTTAAARMPRGACWGAWRPLASSARPMNPPRMPPATPARSARIAPSGKIEDGHGNGIHRCDQPHSAAKPTVPISAPATTPRVSGLFGFMRQATSSTSSASTT